MEGTHLTLIANFFKNRLPSKLLAFEGCCVLVFIQRRLQRLFDWLLCRR